MTGKLKICNFGKNMLQIFYVTTLFAAIYLILGFADSMSDGLRMVRQELP